MSNEIFKIKSALNVTPKKIMIRNKRQEAVKKRFFEGRPDKQEKYICNIQYAFYFN